MKRPPTSIVEHPRQPDCTTEAELKPLGTPGLQGETSRKARRGGVKNAPRCTGENPYPPTQARRRRARPPPGRGAGGDPLLLFLGRPGRTDFRASGSDVRGGGKRLVAG